MSGGDQFGGQQPGATAEFEYQAIAGTHRGQQVHDPRSARGSVGTEAPVMDRSEIVPVVHIA